ncbi:MAG: hypothetical protein LAP39_16270 [Acidobacteriia bacterium]|nr:hypothetical protein [Terriglobia bacterium]
MAAAPWIYLCIVAAINLYVCHEAFTAESTGHWNSMHGIWMALARLAGLDWFSPRWWPYWGGGAPLEYTYSPLVPFATAGIARLFQCSIPLAFHALTGLIYCLGPALLYLAGWRLFQAPGYSFIAALAYSLLSPTEWIVPDNAFHFSSMLSARRMYLMFDWDDLPHMTALALVPPAALLLGRAFESRRALHYAGAGALMACMMLANMFGLVLVALVAVTVPLAIERRFRPALLLRSVLFSAAVYVVICPWLPPSLLRTVRFIAAHRGESDTLPHSLIALSVVLAVSWIIWRLASRADLGWGLRWLLLFSSPVLLTPVLAQYGGPHFLPQPGRYKLEMEVVLAWLCVFGLRPIVDRLSLRTRILLIVPFVVLAGRQIAFYREFGQGMTRHLDVARSLDFRSAKWVEANLPGQRVMMAGSMGQWLNALTDVPQMSGQPYTTAPNWMQQIALYTIFSDQNAGDRGAEYSILWLKAFGAQAVAVPGPQSPEPWKAFVHPRKFDGVLEALWREDDTTIYRVPQSSNSLAHILRPNQLVQSVPVHGLDVDELRQYVAALNSPSSPATFEWRGPNRAVVRATVAPGEVVSAQINYHPGWRAMANGRRSSVRSDGIGLLAITPNCTGECEITLEYDGGLESTMCRTAAVTMLLLLFAYAIIRRVRRNWPFCERARA